MLNSCLKKQNKKMELNSKRIILINKLINSQMSHDQIHQDSLLSSISNISVKIDHTQIDDPGFFIQTRHKSIDDHQIDCEVNIDALEDDEDIDPASLVKQIYYRYRGKDIGMEERQMIEPWVGKRVGGLSEEEQQSEQMVGDVAKDKGIQPSIQAQIPQANILLVESQPKQSPHLTSPQQQRRLKNETKNIPKNYGKAIITFIQKYEPHVRTILTHHNIDYDEFTSQLRQKKRVINTIADLRSMWLDFGNAKSMRVLSNLFLRKYALSYIFNSRICNYASHIKYRYRLSEAIKQPGLFRHIKDY